ncbi:toll/interleukin-1 receptor domain-containing protein [Streptomyces sp. NBC_00663]|uniref:toll/interleukin-1 receptor domain-containing protein n=1 Tax=Streptomyces sp. NBC_00663 TaxID=2975801 RepID=UPI002E35265D|nr:toll/interleukin-1 receptor domain-containing protein [Streptomyces sp. NBC_00663]
MLKIFLCHSSGDKPDVRLLRARLQSEGFEPWLDEEEILPGQDWDREIRRAIQAADLILVCLSKDSVTKAGYVQKEIRLALDEADYQPDGTVYVIPARLENCEVPERLRRWQWVDLFADDGYGRLLRSLRSSAGLPERRGTAPPTVSEVPAPGGGYAGAIRVDGFYQRPDTGSTNYLRFYTDGTVVSVSSTGTAEQIAGWFTREHPGLGQGPCEVNGDQIGFTTTAPYGRITYTGTIGATGEELHLHSHSHINGHESYSVYRFTHVPGVHGD